MIIEYNRPKTIPEALKLLSREQPVTYALGGGTYINRDMEGQFAVVDLQDLKLASFEIAGNQAHLGATTTLNELLSYKGLPGDLHIAIQHQATYNLRQMATVAGTLVTADGRSPFATVMLAIDSTLEIHKLDSQTEQVKLGDWLPMRKQRDLSRLITRISFPANLNLVYEYIARTPYDQPIICAALAQWNSGRTRLVLGGWGEAPSLALDGPEPAGAESAARNASSQAGDQWASAEYRQEMAVVLTSRCLRRVGPESKSA